MCETRIALTAPASALDGVRWQCRGTALRIDRRTAGRRVGPAQTGASGVKPNSSVAGNLMSPSGSSPRSRRRSSPHEAQRPSFASLTAVNAASRCSEADGFFNEIDGRAAWPGCCWPTRARQGLRGPRRGRRWRRTSTPAWTTAISSTARSRCRTAPRSLRGALRTPSLYASALRGPVRRTMFSMSHRRMPISHSS